MKAVLLDRDGTIIVEPPNERLTKAEDIKLFPETIPALKLLLDHGYEIIEITNQAGIGEDLITADDFWKLQINRVEAELSKGSVKIRKTYICPHTANDNCVCRKPKPYLLQQAAKELGFALDHTYMIGDNLSDIQAGIAADAKTVLVKTGTHEVKTDQATFIATNLSEAAEYIIDH